MTDPFAIIAALQEQNAKLRADRAFLIGTSVLLCFSLMVILWMLR